MRKKSLNANCTHIAEEKVEKNVHYMQDKRIIVLSFKKYFGLLFIFL